MSSVPEVSVVMAVYNGASLLPASIEGILTQQEVNLEFIIVDDGSIDTTPAILARYAALDARIRVLRQDHAGLTPALITGCAAARGDYIARQDAGDLSLPRRLHRQLQAMRSCPAAVLVSCGTRFVDADGDYLYSITQTEREAEAGLRALTLQSIRGPSHHGATLFLRSAYLDAGGYRACFDVAQDLDLWLRLREHGAIMAIPDILYEALLAVESISGQRRRQQLATANIILACARLRCAGAGEREALASLANIGDKPWWDFGFIQQARHFYFLAGCVQAHDPEKARRYYRRALRQFPLHLKAWWRWLSVAA